MRIFALGPLERFVERGDRLGHPRVRQARGATVPECRRRSRLARALPEHEQVR